jgi:hypothetical protein
MPRSFSATNERRTATKRIVFCCGCVVLSLLANVWFGLLPRIQAADSILPDRQVATAPTKIQPKLVASHGQLRLSFEANQGSAQGTLGFLSRGLGYTLVLTGDAALVVSLQNPAGVAPTFRLAHTWLEPGHKVSKDKPTISSGPVGLSPISL